MTVPTKVPTYTKRPVPTPKSGAIGLLGWLGVEFANIQKTNPGRFIPSWVRDLSRVPDAATRSASDKMAEQGPSLFDYKGVTGGGEDVTRQWRMATADAIANGFGQVTVPSGLFTIASAITISSQVTYVGMGNPSGGLNAAASASSTVLKGFSGNLFTFDGADGSTVASGGGMRNLRIVQAYSGGPGVSGSAITITGTDVDHRVNWMQLDNVIIEEAGLSPWTWAINVDGHAFGVYDIRIQDCSTHTTGTGAIRLNGCGGAIVLGTPCYDSGAHIWVGDTNTSSSVQFSDVQAAGNLVLDRAPVFGLVGGVFTNITNTINTSGSLRPNRLVNPFVDNSGGLTAIDYFDGAAWVRYP